MRSTNTVPPRGPCKVHGRPGSSGARRDGTSKVATGGETHPSRSRPSCGLSRTYGSPRRTAAFQLFEASVAALPGA